MRRLLFSILTAALLIAGTSACGPPSSSQGSQPSAPGEAAPELTKEIIDVRINDARVYDVPPENPPGDPIPWGFDEDEPKEITVIDQKVEGNSATVVLDIKTSSSPRSRVRRHLAGQIRTDWQLRTGWVLRRWEIVNTENISMKYRDDPPPALPPGAASPTR
jgi:hypothetical protein